jgi:hypothetical protein
VPTEDSNLSLAEFTSLHETVRKFPLEMLARMAADPALTEDLALALLQRGDLEQEVIEEFSKNSSALKSRKVKLAIIAHSKTPRYVSISLLRQLFTFDLMKVLLTPVIAGDIKAAAEEALIKRLESLSPGERMSLARRASGRVAGALLFNTEARVIRTALENPRLTEAIIIKTLMSPSAPAALVQAVCQHPKWSLRRDIRIALLRNDKTPVRLLAEFAQSFSSSQLKEVLQSACLPQAVKNTILKEHC